MRRPARWSGLVLTALVVASGAAAAGEFYVYVPDGSIDSREPCGVKSISNPAAIRVTGSSRRLGGVRRGSGVLPLASARHRRL